MEQAIFGAGCFWGVESAFAELAGVEKTSVGYCGGDLDSPTYEDVCTDTTGHAEVVLVVFDPAKISYDALLEKFFTLHDPTQIDGQGPDYGRQYRSVIFPQTERQAEQARNKILELGKAGRFKRPLATTIEPMARFWRAEEYHQQYYAKRGGGSCRL